MRAVVGYEEFLATVYGAETEETEGKVLNVKAKAMTVEKVVDKNEPTDLQDIKQQIESLAMIMKSTTVENVKLKEGEGVLSLKRSRCFKTLLRKHSKGHLRRAREFLNQGRSL